MIFHQFQPRLSLLIQRLSSVSQGYAIKLLIIFQKKKKISNAKITNHHFTVDFYLRI